MYYYKARIYVPTLGRFLQTDPIGYEDQFNLYAYVGNDPINLVDPRGTSCQVSGSESRIKTAVCRVDDKKSFEKAGWSKDEIRSLERTYSKAVMKLLNNPTKKVTVKMGEKSFTARAGKVAKNLTQTFVSYRNIKGSSRFADLAGGPATRTIGTGALARPWRPTNRLGLPFEMRLYPLFRSLNEARRMETIIHEGLHTLSEEVRVLPFPYSHQKEYSRAAQELLGD